MNKKKIDGKIYIGSYINLSTWLSHYFSKNYLIKKSSIYKSKIYNAILAHGYDNFHLEILEYCARSYTIEREQFYINCFKPEYNILTKVGSSSNFKHYKETLLKFKSRKLREEALLNLRRGRKGAVLSSLEKSNQLVSRYHVTIIENLKTNETKKYNSICVAARQLNDSYATLLNYIKK